MKKKIWVVLALITAGALIHLLTPVDYIDPRFACHHGAYEMENGEKFIFVGQSYDSQSLRLVFQDGRRKRFDIQDDTTLVASDGSKAHFTACSEEALAYQFADGKTVNGKRIPLVVREAIFKSRDSELFGKLVLPADGRSKAVVVWVQGSDADPETLHSHWQYILPAVHGIGVFVYDKRGTGRSSGDFSANFHLLSDDAAAAVTKARELVNDEAIQIGLFGGSQGGWVAPLASLKTDVDFVIVGYGLAEGVTAEDRDEAIAGVLAAGYGAEVIPSVLEVTSATAKIVASDWQEGWEEFSRVREKHEDAPWLKEIKGGYTEQMLQMPNFLIRILGPMLDKDVSFDHDPLPTLQSIDVPMLWILGGEDTSAPPRNTLKILGRLKEEKTELDIAWFPNARHGIIEGEKETLRYAEDYFNLVGTWVVTKDFPEKYTNFVAKQGAGGN